MSDQCTSWEKSFTLTGKATSVALSVKRLLVEFEISPDLISGEDTGEWCV